MLLPGHQRDCMPQSEVIRAIMIKEQSMLLHGLCCRHHLVALDHRLSPPAPCVVVANKVMAAERKRRPTPVLSPCAPSLWLSVRNAPRQRGRCTTVKVMAAELKRWSTPVLSTCAPSLWLRSRNAPMQLAPSLWLRVPNTPRQLTAAPRRASATRCCLDLMPSMYCTCQQGPGRGLVHIRGDSGHVVA